MIRYSVISFFLLIGLVIGAVFVNNSTRELEREVRIIQREIAKNNREIEILKASWEYLTNPLFIKELAQNQHFNLGLIESTEKSYGSVEEIPFLEGMEAEPFIGNNQVNLSY